MGSLGRFSVSIPGCEVLGCAQMQPALQTKYRLLNIEVHLVSRQSSRILLMTPSRKSQLCHMIGCGHETQHYESEAWTRNLKPWTLSPISSSTLHPQA